MIVFENKILRIIYGPTQENGEWRKRHNRQIRDLYKDYDVLAHIKARRIRWARHVLRRERGSLLKEISLGKPEGKWPLGRPKKRWWDNITRDIVKVGAAAEEAEDREMESSWCGQIPPWA
uniref:Uncharacterized protein n=1 Tax=Cuerna arida TaxID=1464854 RepID=A0A1B6EST2_9HEMI